MVKKKEAEFVVTKFFWDRVTGEPHNPGEPYKANAERLKEVLDAGHIEEVKVDELSK